MNDKSEKYTQIPTTEEILDTIKNASINELYSGLIALRLLRSKYQDELKGMKA